MSSRKNKKVEQVFRSDFLNNLLANFKRRSKALRNQGDLAFELGDDGKSEWLCVYLSFFDWPSIDLVIDCSGITNLRIRSQIRANHGKILFRIDGLAIQHCGPRVVEVFESTIQRRTQIDGDPENPVLDELRNEWQSLTLRLVK